jgi:hypothetical protein
MIRKALLTAVAVMFASSPSLAQFGGMGGGVGGGMGGGMGGQGTQGMMMQGNRSARAFFTDVSRSAQVEMEGGQSLSGKIELRPVVVDADLGQYVITPHKIKTIRFLKPIGELNPPGGDEAQRKNIEEGGDVDEADLVPQVRQKRAAVMKAGRGGVSVRAGGGFGLVADQNSRTGAAVLVRGKVITTADKEIIGMIHIPSDFTLELDFGSLLLTPEKLRSISFTDDHRNDKPVRREPSAPGTHENTGRPASSHDHASPPRYFRQGSSVVVVSPVGDRVTLYNVDTKKSDSLDLSGSKDAPLEVTPVVAGNLVALWFHGPKVTRIAVADTSSGTWHAQELREALDGETSPIVAPGVAVYTLGRNVYAYGAESQRWDVAELPEGVRAMPIVAPGSVTIESDGHIYTFAGKTGKWNHVDIRAILDDVAAQKK